MPFRLFLLAGACALLPVLAHCAETSPVPLPIELRASALVTGSRIVLGDVAVIASQPMASSIEQVELGRAPRVGYVERVTRAQVEQAIRRQQGAAPVVFAWSGADSAAVRVRSQTVASYDLAAAAVAAVQKDFAAPGIKLEVAAVIQPADLQVPSGAVELRPRRAASAVLAPRMPQWIDLVVDGAVYRSVVVQLAVTARQLVYVAKHSMAQGAWASEDDFSVEETNVAGLVPAPVAGRLAPFRLAVPLKANQPLSSSAMSINGKVLRGDQVRLVTRSGQIGIETMGIAMAEASPGQLLTVRPAGASAIVTGRVSHSGTVDIE